MLKTKVSISADELMERGAMPNMGLGLNPREKLLAAIELSQAAEEALLNADDSSGDEDSSNSSVSNDDRARKRARPTDPKTPQ